MLVCSAGLLQFSRWVKDFDNLGAGVVFVTIAGLGLCTFFLINLLMDTKTRAANTSSVEAAAEQDARQMDENQMGGKPIKSQNSYPNMKNMKKSRSIPLRKRKKQQQEESERESTAFNQYVNSMRLPSTSPDFEVVRIDSDIQLEGEGNFFIFFLLFL
jgi:hypothetical protein